ncbi:RING finger protein 32-like [Elysia marginata]|uniref:RING finger protein 32-like n=1 Tax=Elysia marginata TaxID=1093978 RepID=A0AAV4IY96_9GAST|nr:RING finger protein 32-like [Elysia marginata]
MSEQKSYKMPAKKVTDTSSVALTAMALQDHWTRTLSLGTTFGPRKVNMGPATRARQKQKREAKPVVDTGRNRVKQNSVKVEDAEKEYVLDEKPPPLTLAQKFGLVQAPKQLLSEKEWSGVKAKSNQRDDSGEPCVICKEDFGLQEQVILSCSHVFHRACLSAFERFTGRKTCPMCRHEQYQTRVIHEGARVYRHKAAANIQANWRGYVVRTWYKKLRETVPPKDPLLKKKFYEEKLTAIVDRMIKSIDVNMADFLREIDSSVQQSRAVFNQWDALHNPITPEMWDAIQLKAVERGDVDCPICLTELHLSTCPPQHHEPQRNIVQTNTQQTSGQPRSKSNNFAANSKSSRKQQDRQLLEKLSGTVRNAAAAGDATRDSDCNSLLGYEDTNHNSTTNTSGTTEATRNASSNSVQALPSQARLSGRQYKKSGSSMFVTQSKREMEAPTVTGSRRIRATVLLSCTHVFHSTCLRTLEEMAMVEMRNTCPVCRAHYQKKVINF